jgi:hypothetical protein
LRVNFAGIAAHICQFNSHFAMKSIESRDSAQLKAAAGNESGESEGKSLAPPAFQLKVGSDSNAEENPAQRKVAASGMPEYVQQKMESSMGADFSGVKVHAESSKATEMGALAYAQGKDVHFAPGQYKPDTQSGQELIGHELAHIKQQSEGRVKANTEVAGAPVNDDPKLEQEADRMGQQAAQAKVDPSANKQQIGGGGNALQGKFVEPVQRQEAEGQAEPEAQSAEPEEGKPDMLVEAQALAAEAGLVDLAAQPDQEQPGQEGAQAGHAGPEAAEGQESVQRKAAGGPDAALQM